MILLHRWNGQHNSFYRQQNQPLSSPQVYAPDAWWHWLPYRLVLTKCRTEYNETDLKIPYGILPRVIAW